MLKKLPLLALLVSAPLFQTAFAHESPLIIQDGAPAYAIDVSNIPDAIPRYEPKSLLGNPKVYHVDGRAYHVLESNEGYRALGTASWYGRKFHGQSTASGEPYNMFAMTAASPDLPLPTYVRVTNLDNGKQIIVKVNDRGPFRKNRIIDLSYVAAKKLDMLAQGTAPVRLEAIDVKPPKNTTKHKRPLYLQTGIFRKENNALREHENVRKLLAHIAPVLLKIRHTQHGLLYQVAVGPIRDVSMNNQIIHQLRSAGLPKPYPIRFSSL